MGLQRWLVEARAMIRAALTNLGDLSTALGTAIGEARNVAVIDSRLPFDAATAWQLQPKANEVRSAIGALEGRLAGAQEKLGNAEQELTSASVAKQAGIARAFDLQAFKLEVDGARRQLADFGLSAAVAATASETVASPPINGGRIVQITYQLPTGVPGQTVPVGVSFLGDMRGPCVLASMIDPQFYINWRFQPLANGAYQLRVNNSPTGLVLAAPWRLEDPVEVVPEALLGQRPDRAWWTFVGNYLVSTFDRRNPYILGPNFDQQPADRVFGSIVSGVRLLGPNARLRNEALPGFFEVYLLFY